MLIRNRNYRLIWPLLILGLALATGCSRETAAPEESAPRETDLPSSDEQASGTPNPTEQGLSGTENDDEESGVVHLPLALGDNSIIGVNQTPTGSPDVGLLTSPEEISPTPTIPTKTATPTPMPFPQYDGPPLSRDHIGIQIHLHREDLDLIIAHLRTLGVGWVKVQVSWKLYQPELNRYDDFRFEELDRLVEAAAINDIKVLLGVAKAPEWSRPITDLDGPPNNFSHFQDFMSLLAERYRGRVQAYELWNEPNLKREWNGFPLSASELSRLVQAGANGVRSVDGEAILISGAPAPTGINDGLTAIDDRLYLTQMVQAGILDAVDAVGVHPYGWANPPDSTVDEPDPAVPSHNDHPSFFYLDTLTDYRQILEQYGGEEVPLWATEFGWASYDGFGVQPPEGVAYMNGVDEWQQASYTLRAYEIADRLDWNGPLVLWNLNFAPTFGPDFVESAYSVLRPDGSARPVYSSLATALREE